MSGNGDILPGTTPIGRGEITFGESVQGALGQACVALHQYEQDCSRRTTPVAPFDIDAAVAKIVAAHAIEHGTVYGNLEMNGDN